MPSPPTSTEEVEGFLEGVAHRLRVLRREGRPDVASEGRAEQARQHLAAGRPEEAESVLIQVDRTLRVTRQETELTQVPRGLIGYVPIGERGVPPPREEEQLSNRLTLVLRLLEVRRSQGCRVEPYLPRLAEAEEAYRRGDRSTARRLTDEVHAALEEIRPSTRSDSGDLPDEESARRRQP